MTKLLEVNEKAREVEDEERFLILGMFIFMSDAKEHQKKFPGTKIIDCGRFIYVVREL